MKSWRYILGFLSLVTVSVWLTVVYFPEERLHLIACDVGQGDAILAQYGANQILIDGGKGREVLDCLARHAPFWDREIELVVLTHPQLDHYGGLIEVFRRYRVNTFLANSLDSSSTEYQELKKVAAENGSKIINPDENVTLRVGEIYFDVVTPTSDFLSENLVGYTESNASNVLGAQITKKDPNDFSIVANLRFGEFDALLTGDIGPEVTDEILATGEIHDIEYLKVPHHGSKNGLTKDLLDAANPEIAVISVGKNPWGHPHEEVLEILRDKKIEILRTDELGDVEVITDGEDVWLNY